MPLESITLPEIPEGTLTETLVDGESHRTIHNIIHEQLPLAIDELGIAPTADTLQGYVRVGDDAGHGIWTPQTALLGNALIQGDPLPLQLEGNGPFTSATTPNNNDGSYVFDAWYVLSDGNDIADCSVVTSGLPTGARGKYRLDVETVNKKVGLCQIAEFSDISDILEAGCCSLSWDQQVTGTSINGVRALILAWTSTADSPTKDLVSAWGSAGTIITPVSNWAVATGGDSGVIVPTTSWVTNAISNATIGSTVTNIAVFIYIDDLTTTLGDFLELTNICLVPGPAPLRAPRRSASTEQQRTRRLFRIVGGLAAGDVIGFGNTFSTTQAIVGAAFDPPMRTTPSVTYPTASNMRLNDSAGTTINLTAASTQFGPTARSVGILCTVASGLTVGHGTWLMSTNTSGGIRLNARLGV